MVEQDHLIQSIQAKALLAGLIHPEPDLESGIGASNVFSNNSLHSFSSDCI
jgi:hypothetical protein